MRTGVLILDQFDIFLNRCAAVEHRCPNVGHVLSEPGVLVSDLEGQLASVTQYKNRDFAVDGLDLL